MTCIDGSQSGSDNDEANLLSLRLASTVLIPGQSARCVDLPPRVHGWLGPLRWEDNHFKLWCLTACLTAWFSVSGQSHQG